MQTGAQLVEWVGEVRGVIFTIVPETQEIGPAREQLQPYGNCLGSFVVPGFYERALTFLLTNR
jgi:hypothetical protein